MAVSFAAALGVFLPSAAVRAVVIEDETLWQPQAGDELIVDVGSNVGMLVRGDRSASLLFPVATGQRRIVYHPGLGRSYRADTPLRHWTVRSTHTKGDRRTYGRSGLFLRLYNGEASTPYGIHVTVWNDEWMASADRYFSMGCIVPKNQRILDAIHETYLLNGNRLDVTTVASFDQRPELVAVADAW